MLHPAEQQAVSHHGTHPPTHLSDLVLEGCHQAVHACELIHDVLHLSLSTAAQVVGLLLQDHRALQDTAQYDTAQHDTA